MRKYFKKYMESLWTEDMILSKKISTLTAINKRWPREVVKLFVNVRFFSKLKKLEVSLKENSKKNVRILKQTAQFMF